MPARPPIHQWTNADCIRWLLDTDLKQFVPAFARNGITGAILARLEDHNDHTKLAELLTYRVDEAWSDLQLDVLSAGIAAELPPAAPVKTKADASTAETTTTIAAHGEVVHDAGVADRASLVRFHESAAHEAEASRPPTITRERSGTTVARDIHVTRSRAPPSSRCALA